MLNYNWTAPLPSMLIHTKVKNKRLMWCICLSMSKKTHQNGINLFYANVPLLYFLCFSNNFREYRNWKFFWSRLMPCSWTNIYLFKVNNRNTRKRYEICPKSTTNTIESCSGVFTIKCFCCWLYIGKFLSRSSFLSKYY